MVSKPLGILRGAFTMIELIFAIIIISIVVISLPVMTRITSAGVEQNLLQEAIFAASAEITGAMAYDWDENSAQDINLSSASRVVDISGNCENNASSDRFRFKPGHIVEFGHRRCLESNATAAADVNTTGTAMEAAAHGNAVVFDAGAKNATSYKQNYQSNLSVTRAANSNMKDINVTIMEENTSVVVRLNIKSYNIGEIDFFKRRF